MTKTVASQVIERAAQEHEGYYDPRWSLPYLVNVRLKRKLAAWAQKLPHSSRVLDIGCARGDLLGLIGKNRPDLQLVGVDLSSGMTRLAKQRFTPLNIAQADGTRLPFPDRTFDAVIIMHLFSNLDPQRLAPALMREACRVSQTWVIAEIKVPSILRLQMAIRRVLLHVPVLRWVSSFLFATIPAAELPEVYIHEPEVLLNGLEECTQIRPWSLLPTPSRAHVVLRPGGTHN